jgi:hypothetical protein
MISRYKFYDNVYNDDINHFQKGLVRDNIKELFKSNDDVMYKIPKKEQYRPDLISQRFYGEPKLYWVLVFVNDFGNSPEDFDEGAVIRIPYYNKVIELI